jgi:hypothetical protein
MTDDRLKHKTSKASDLEPQFEEILTEFVGQLMELASSVSLTLPLGEFLQTAAPEVEKTKQRLLDAVANTTMMDPH